MMRERLDPGFSTPGELAGLPVAVSVFTLWSGVLGGLRGPADYFKYLSIGG